MTVKELAEKCGVSEQSIRAYCNKLAIAKAKGESGQLSYLIDEATEKAIIQHYSAKGMNEKPKAKEESSKEKDETTKALIELLREQISNQAETIKTLQQQLAVKDSQIEKLLDANAELNKSIQQAHTLHYNEQQQLTVSDSDLTEPTEQEQLQEKKRGFFSKFKRK